MCFCACASEAIIYVHFYLLLYEMVNCCAEGIICIKFDDWSYSYGFGIVQHHVIKSTGTFRVFARKKTTRIPTHDVLHYLS